MPPASSLSKKILKHSQHFAQLFQKLKLDTPVLAVVSAAGHWDVDQ